MLDVTPVPAFSDNYIWLIHGLDDRRRVAIVDPGDASPVISVCDELDLEPVALVITHHHWDHVGGIGALVKRFDVPVYGPASEAIPCRTHPLTEGDRSTLTELNVELQALAMPGHTAGQLAYTGHDSLFCGDTLFSAGCGRLFEGTPAEMVSSLGKLAKLAPQTRVYCGHEYTVNNLEFALTVEPGNADARDYLEQARDMRTRGQPTLPSTIDLERKVNPFLRCTEASVRQAAETRSGQQLDDNIAVFSVIRRWKDEFQ